MEMSKQLELGEEHVKYLLSQPEQGMGYQIVWVKLREGKILENRIVLNSSILLVENWEDIQQEDIISVGIMGGLADSGDTPQLNWD